jgi:hypothetical protein
MLFPLSSCEIAYHLNLALGESIVQVTNVVECMMRNSKTCKRGGKRKIFSNKEQFWCFSGDLVKMRIGRLFCKLLICALQVVRKKGGQTMIGRKIINEKKSVHAAHTVLRFFVTAVAVLFLMSFSDTALAGKKIVTLKVHAVVVDTYTKTLR